MKKKLHKQLIKALPLLLLFFLTWANMTKAQLVPFESNLSGKYEITAGGKGSNTNPYTITINKPAGATTVYKVYMYNAGIGNATPSPTITVDGNNYTFPASAMRQATDTRGGFTYTHRGYSGEVAGNLKTKLSTATAGSNINFSVREGSLTNSTDGVGIIVIWNNPTKPIGSFFVYMGMQSIRSAPDGTKISIPVSAIDKTILGFKPILGIGINYSTGECNPLPMGCQLSKITVNGNTLTEKAGGYDDGFFEDGAFITLGGYGDNPDNNDEDEVYNINSLLNNGTTSLDFVFTDVSGGNDDYLNVIYFSGVGVTPTICSLVPPVVETPISNICPITTVNLNTQGVSEPLPSGAVLQWWTTATRNAGTQVANPNAVGAGTYYAFYYDSSNSCYSPASNGVAVTIQSCSTCTGPDSDGDGIADACDLDDDNDGILDTVECSTYIPPSPNIIIQSPLALYSYNVNTATLAVICTGSLNNITDIAVSPSGVMYAFSNPTSTTGRLSILNQNNCIATTLKTYNFTGNSLSILPDGNILVGGPSSSIVYKIDVVGGTYNATVWRNFGTGTATGDFIYINGKVYVLWFDTAVSTTNPIIREVTVDANYNYVSQKNLGTVQTFSYGLAKANGDELYAVTGNTNSGGLGTIIKINYKGTFSWTVISAFTQPLYGATSLEEGAGECDTDGDGILDRLDLDSDNDGCLDAIEGAGTFTDSQLSTASGTITVGTGSVATNQNFGTSVDANGVPITVGSAGQGVGNSQNASINDCLNPCIISASNPDSDGDNIADACDLDADNDGILNTNECVNPLGAAVIWSGDGTSGLNPQIFQPTVITSSGTTAATIGSGLTSISVFLSSYQLSGISSTTTTLSGAIAQNDYVEYQFRTANWNTSVPNRMQYVFDRTSVFHQSVNPINYKFAVLISKDNFATNTVLLNDLSKLNTNNIHIYKNPDYALSPNTQYKVRVYFYSLASSVSILFDNFTVRVTEYCDTDGDGIPNYLDLDSDNDGCLDALEGGDNLPISNLVSAGGTVTTGIGSSVSNQNLCSNSTCVGSTGIPLIVNQTTGQIAGSSANAFVKATTCSGFCYKPASMSGTALDTKHGITSLSRAGAEQSDNWPMVRKGAWTALESKTKGFVVNRIPTTSAVNAISDPVEGMTVYDEEAKCLKIYTLKDGASSMSWHCMITPACPN